MSEVQQSAPITAVTVEAAKQKMNIALTKLSISTQKMQDEANGLVFNEDQENIDKIKDFIERSKKAEKSIESEHKEGKNPFLEAGRAWDNAKNQLLGVVGEIKNPVVAKYTTLCNEIDRKNREAEQKAAKEKEILGGIEANVLIFSQKIASCLTSKELTDVERLINLEKSPTRASKYGDHHKTAIDRFNEVLIPIIKDQKIKIDEREALESKLNDAVDPEKHDELKQQLEEKNNEIMQNQVKVQEQALSQQPEVIEPEVIATTVKTKRTDIVPEIVDLAVVFKKHRELLNIDLKISDAKKLGETMKTAGAFGDKEEITVDGIKFTIKKSW